MGIESDNPSNGTLSEFFSYGSVTTIGGYGASDLDALGVGWEE